MRADPDIHPDDDSHQVLSRPPSRPDSPGRGSSNPTPLLTATLNAPPQSFYQSTQVRVKNSTDLPTENSASGPQPVFYSTLLKQLRQKTGDNVKGMKREKSVCAQKPLPFICPACKKRFQRHIAMNAHFQNEHISAPGPSGERQCRLCGHSGSGLAAVRLHLASHHNIDLDNPARCLVEDPNKYSVLEASLRSGTSQEESEPSCSNLDMSGSSRSCSPQLTPSPAHTPCPSSSQSPERSLFPIKSSDSGPNLKNLVDDEEDVQVEDLSLRRPNVTQRSVGRFSPAPKSPRPESPSAKPSKRPRVSESVSESVNPRFCCNHCNIVYPNQTLYFLHKGFHSESNPWKCNGCGHQATDLYDFNTHLFSVSHQ